MTGFISSKNQEMLWKTIQKNHLFGDVLTIEEQPIWFREIIGNVYHENSGKDLKQSELLEINKNTLKYMVHDLKERLTKQNSNTFTNPINEPIYDRIEPKSSSYQNEFEKLQNDYNNLHKRIIPREPNFKEQINDEKISNMDELIEKQLKEREIDLIPRPQLQPNHVHKNSNEEKINNIEMSINTTSNATNIEIDELKNKISKLELKIDVLEKEINSIKNQTHNMDISNNLVIHQ